MLTQTRRLPLYVALAALVVYTGSMGGGLTFNELALASKLAGWGEPWMTSHPLLWLLTLPMQVVPAAWIPLLLKLLAVVLAAAILGLLTRTVQLLPWEHPWDNAGRLACALPGLTAAAVCGLEFSFWQEATTTCGDLLDLLLLATAGWLLLEYNIRRELRWLNAATFVWGLGMAENWLMLLALPLYVATVVWLRRTKFFRWEFILRLAGLGLAGFSVYVVLPMATGLWPRSPWTLGQAWVASLHQTKSALLLPHTIWRADRFVGLTAAICFLVPIMPLLVRMRDEGMRYESRAGRFQLWLYRGLRLGLLLACCWLAFDPNPGARQAMRQMGIRQPLLTFDYLNALGAAFLTGSFLLISGWVIQDLRRRSREMNSWRRLPVPFATVSLTAIAVGLAARNLPAIWRMNHHPVEQFGELAVKSLPAGCGVVLSDDPDKLIVFQAALARGHMEADWVTVETPRLPTVKYRARLEQRRPTGWLTDQTRHELTPVETLGLLEQVARTNRLFYLHPGDGQLFEGFYPEPIGTIYELKLRGKNPVDLPPMPAAIREANEQFWTRLWDQKLAAMVPPPPRPAWWKRKMAQFGLSPAPRDEDHVLREWFSLPLEGWGMTLQEQGRLREAQARFEEVLKLNANNLSARVSLSCNTNLQAGHKLALFELHDAEDRLDNHDRVNLMRKFCGPFDEPTDCYVLGSGYYDYGWLVQAEEQLERVRTLTPGSPGPELLLAEIYNRLRMPDHSRPLVDQVRAEIQKLPANSTLDLDLALVESQLCVLQTNLAKARGALQSVLNQHPDDPEIANRVMSAYLALSDVTNALELAEERLAKSPDDLPSLKAKALILKQTGQAAAALPIMDHVLALTNDPPTRLNRAFARIETRDFASAKCDLDELNTNGQVSVMVDLGLGLVADHGHETNSARHYFQLCLSNSPAGTPAWLQAHIRLKMLEPAMK